MKSKIFTFINLVFIGMVVITNADPSYNFNGEWDAVIIKEGIESVTRENDIIIISQKGEEFVGTRIKGGKFVGKNETMFKGKLLNKMVQEIFIHYMSDPFTYELSWCEGRAAVINDGNKIVIQSFIKNTGFFETVTLTRNKQN